MTSEIINRVPRRIMIAGAGAAIFEGILGSEKVLAQTSNPDSQKASKTKKEPGLIESVLGLGTCLALLRVIEVGYNIEERQRKRSSRDQSPE